MAKAEPNLAEANRPIRTEPEPDAVTIDVGHTLAVLRSENARLKANAAIAARNDGIDKKNAEHRQKEILRLQAELLASQERVYELQNKLLSLREIVNGA
jgi:predicted RNase H-like nuclease (RuvC/YqgF family)